MKNWKQSIFFGIVAIIALCFGFVGCDDGDGKDDPKPVEQTKDIEIATGKTVTVVYTALPDTTPAWWSTLEEVFHNRAHAFDIGHFTLIVQSSGTDGFVAGTAGSKTATVSEAFLATSDYTAMRASMGVMVDYWIAMMELNAKIV
jgi:hypothetical protein